MSHIHEKLREHAAQIQNTTLTELFAQEPNRIADNTYQIAGIYADLSKNHINQQTAKLWQQWAEQAGVAEGIAAITRGDNVNTGEHRPALHHALRAPAEGEFVVNGIDVNAEIRDVRQRMKSISKEIRNGNWKGYDGQTITDIIHIGIGGSELGPRLLCEAFAHEADGPNIHFLATPDPVQIRHLQKQLNPATTLLIVASKSFGTEETLENAKIMRDWLRQAGGEATDQRMIALSANVEKAAAFGITAERVLPFWDWVGGRFSLWSAISLPFILQNGYDYYARLLNGAHQMDQHFQTADTQDNLPIQLALLDCWYNHYFGINNRSLIMYAHSLAPFPQYLQQLDMESLGKRATRDGKPLTQPSGMIIWGGTGTEAQHAFFQLLHQGQRRIPLDFITVKKAPEGMEHAASIIHGHCLAQAEALMRGRDESDLQDIPEAERYQRTCPGNRPSTMLILDELTPECLGAMIALYEHKTTILGILYDVNAYDQWGVELGKVLAKGTEASLRGEIGKHHDASTESLIKHLKS
ncbi:glucose-6-phosphate isomerase [Suttonella ornithocola]|uniref:Glucose-6-phosphate isomerase n=1 Tax=Suttonella ornithocola TaxID=279832 RepID=A0A380MN69_9GAMM|nr:glucose-6-phosphate isomerase [Suttonella ornithocola]SUO93624.1 Glucose-6-phosphate isomerase [Suttonella ornithocola]